MAGPAAEFAAVPDTAVLQHFRECSLEAREVLDKLQVRGLGRQRVSWSQHVRTCRVRLTGGKSPLVLTC